MEEIKVGKQGQVEVVRSHTINIEEKDARDKGWLDTKANKLVRDLSLKSN